jgi:hypothetical protein
MSDKLNANEDLVNVGSITSQDGRFTLIMQGDGNLVLYRSGGNARWATNTDGRVVSQAIMQGDGNFVMYGPGGSYIWDTATDGHPGAYLTIQNDGNIVIYDTVGNPLWASNTNIVHRTVPGFLPSSSGLHFTNSFPSGIPLLYINVLGAQIPIGDASNGLCGGMGYTVRDYFEAGMTPPSDTTPPTSGILFDFLVRRLFDSFNLPAGPTKYIRLMDPALPDHETSFSDAGLAPHGRAWVMINEEWPKIRSDIDSGHLSPIGLVSIKSPDPFKMGENHQVLAYGYEMDNTNLTIWVYDPNFKDNNNITISLSLANPRQSTSVSYSGTIYGGDQKIWCFFRPDYGFVTPPSIAPPVGIGDHFYTASASERDNAITSFGYRSEDIACYVLSTPARTRKPLYRLLNQGSGDHFYTASKEECDSAVVNSGYQKEGIACYVFASPTSATTAFYRLYNPVNGDHFYTISASERDNALASFGYQDEGIACYVYQSKAKGRIPFYRLLKIA